VLPVAVAVVGFLAAAAVAAAAWLQGHLRLRQEH